MNIVNTAGLAAVSCLVATSGEGIEGGLQVSVIQRLAGPLDERLDLTNSLHSAILSRPVPEHARRYYFCFGGIALFLFLLEAVTGVILTFYYVPTPDKAYASVYYISHYVNYGWLIRSVHGWGAQLMVVFVIGHMLRVYLTGSYKNPRELNWVVGVALFAATMAFSLTGHLLPWDSRAYWGSTVTLSLVRKIPVVGSSVAYAMMGADSIGAATLARFFSAHIMLLPGVLIALAVIHFWMVRKQGISGPL